VLVARGVQQRIILVNAFATDARREREVSVAIDSPGGGAIEYHAANRFTP
jgi:microcompartment protein CcmK/EutM